MDFVPAKGGGVYSTSRRARTLRAHTIREAVETCREEIEANDRRLEKECPTLRECVENGVAASWRLVNATGRGQVSTFPDEEGLCGSQWS